MPETFILTSPVLGVEPVAKLVLSLASILVEEPERVAVHVHHDERGTTFVLLVAAGDLGKIVGKQGRIARSIRIVLNAAAFRLGRVFLLDIRSVTV